MRDSKLFIPEPSHLEPFLLLPENQFAHAAIQQSTRSGRRSRYSLIYLHGPSGVGKTHLATLFLKLHLAQHADLRYVFRSAADFANKLNVSIRKKDSASFREIYRDLQLLVLDDIDALQRRESAQWELIYTLDALRTADASVLVTSEKRVGELTNVIPRLANRLRAGVAASIELPSLASRARLIEHFSSTYQIPLTKEAGQFLAENLPLAPGGLLAALRKLDSIARQQRCQLDEDFAKRFLSRIPNLPRHTIPKIAGAVARQFTVTLSDLRSRSRTRHLGLPRQCAMLLAREFSNAPLKEIGLYFGNRSHSTVIHACRTVQERAKKDAELRQQLENIRSKLRSRSTPSHVKKALKKR